MLLLSISTEKISFCTSFSNLGKISLKVWFYKLTTDGRTPDLYRSLKFTLKTACSDELKSNKGERSDQVRNTTELQSQSKNTANKVVSLSWRMLCGQN